MSCVKHPFRVRARAIIELEFYSEDVTEADVINYINALIENDCLSYELKKGSGIVVL